MSPIAGRPTEVAGSPGGTIVLLQPQDPPGSFPDPGGALRNPDGLLAMGGDLSPDRLLAAYRRGIFPWYTADQPILWWSPDPRAVLLPGTLRISRSLRRTLRRGTFAVSVDQAFDAVIGQCAMNRADGTWITPAMAAAYRRLHALGYAHSIESWRDGRLAGGLYGVAIGRMFFGESMFSVVPDASKVALVRLMAMARQRDLALIDCQVASRHLASLGSRVLPRAEFLAAVAELTASPPCAAPWPDPARQAGEFLALAQPAPPLHR